MGSWYPLKLETDPQLRSGSKPGQSSHHRLLSYSIDSKRLEDYLKFILHYKDEDADKLLQRIKTLLSEQQHSDVSAFYLAADQKDREVVRVILLCVDPDSEYSLARGWINHLCNDFYLLLQPDKDILKDLLASLQIEERLQLFDIHHKPIRFCDITILIGSAIYKWSHDTVGVMLESLGSNQYIHMVLSAQDLWEKTPVHYATEYGKNQTLDVMLRMVDQAQRKQLLEIRDWSDRTPVHHAAEKGGHDLMETMQKLITPQRWLELLMLPHPKHWNQDSFYTVMEEYRTKAEIDFKIDCAIHTNDQSGRPTYLNLLQSTKGS